MFCAMCGSPLPDGAKFCPSCGAPVERTSAASATAPAPSPAPQAGRPEPPANQGAAPGTPVSAPVGDRGTMPDLGSMPLDGSGIGGLGSSLLEGDHSFPFGNRDVPSAAATVQRQVPTQGASAAPASPTPATPLDLVGQSGAVAASADRSGSWDPSTADPLPVDQGTGAFAMDGNGSPLESDVTRLAIPLLGQQVNLDQNLLDFARFRDRLATYARECTAELRNRPELKLPTRKVLGTFVDVEFPRYLGRAKDILYEEFSQRQLFGFSQETMDRYIVAYAHRVPELVQAVLAEADEIDEGVQMRQGARTARSRERNLQKHQIDTLRDLQRYGHTGLEDTFTRGMTHVGRSAGSAFGNAVKHLGSKSLGTVRKGLIYRHANQTALVEALQEDITDLAFVLGQALVDLGRENPYYTLENRSQAIEIREQLEANLVPFEQRQNIALRMITTYPFDAESYQSILRTFPEERPGVEAMTRWLRVDLGEDEA